MMPLGIDHTFAAQGPRFEAKDDLKNIYRNRGGHYFGLAANNDPLSASAGACGGFTLPLPDPAARELRVRMTSNAMLASLWERPAREAIVSLQN